MVGEWKLHRSGLCFGWHNSSVKFDGQRVTMASQGYEGDETISSLYKVVSEEATMLTFDTYNAFIHAYAKPQGGGSNPNANLQGDYEFIIKEASAEKIVMQGKKYGNTIVMYAFRMI